MPPHWRGAHAGLPGAGTGSFSPATPHKSPTNLTTTTSNRTTAISPTDQAHLVREQRQLEPRRHIPSQLPKVAAGGGGCHQRPAVEADQHRQQQRLVQLEWEERGSGSGQRVSRRTRKGQNLKVLTSAGLCLSRSGRHWAAGVQPPRLRPTTTPQQSTSPPAQGGRAAPGRPQPGAAPPRAAPASAALGSRQLGCGRAGRRAGVGCSMQQQEKSS